MQLPQEAPRDVALDWRFDKMRGQFTLHEADADARIEALIERYLAPKQIRIVSGDRRLRTAVRKRRSQFISNEDFLEELERKPSVKNQSPTEGKPQPERIPEDEMAEWLEIFGDIEEP